jgi:hypothetical protein
MKIKRCTVTFIVMLLITAACKTTETAKPSEGISPSWADISRSGFIEEMVYPQGTPRTPYFNDYTAGSYHVRKLDLVNGTREFRTNISRQVEAVLILGPSGPLWQYNVVTVVGTGKSSNIVSVNHLVFPHARITYKGARNLRRESYAPIIARILENPSLREPTEGDKQEKGEWNTAAVIATFNNNGSVRVLPNSAFKESEKQAKQLYDEINELLGGEELICTYSQTIKEK